MRNQVRATSPSPSSLSQCLSDLKCWNWDIALNLSVTGGEPAAYPFPSNGSDGHLWRVMFRGSWQPVILALGHVNQQTPCWFSKPSSSSSPTLVLYRPGFRHRSNGNILTIVDRFLKSAHFVPLPRLPSAKEAAELILNQELKKGTKVHAVTRCGYLEQNTTLD